MKKAFWLGCMLVGLFICLFCKSKAEAADIQAVLDDAAGASAFSVQDSGSTEVAHIDSDGNMIIKGGLRLDSGGVENTTAEDLIVDGNVGIGTATPGEKLDVNGFIKIPVANSTDNDSPAIVAVSNDDFSYDGEYINHYGFGFHTYNDGGGSGYNAYIAGYNGIDLFTAGTERLRINSNGNVGIGTGTVSPSTLLDVLAADNATAVTIKINAAQASVTASDTFIDFRSTTGSEGSIAGTVTAGVIAYNTFTGSHYTLIEDREGLESNVLLEMTGEKIEERPKTSPKYQLFKSRICRTKGSKAAIGVYGGTDQEGRDMVLSIGTGFIWVANKGEDIEVGDYLISSDVAGCAELQNDDIYHNNTVAKVTENVKWGKTETRRLISCIYLGG